MPTAPLETYLAVMEDELGRKPGNLRFKMAQVFRGVELAGRSVVDIGAGVGEASFYASCAGASDVTSLEPEAAGSRAGVGERFDRIRDRLGAESVELRGETLQEFDPAGERFDVLVSLASINHLDEDACIRLDHDPEARARYARIFAKLADMSKPGADLIIVEVSSRNVFPRLGFRNPITPTIEWEKHQPPEVWAQLLEEAGFRDPQVSWPSFNSLREPGRVVLGNRMASYFLTSTFRLRMQRA